MRVTVAPNGIGSFERHFALSRIRAIHKRIEIEPPVPLEKDMFVEPALVLMLNIPRIHVRPETIANINESGLEKNPFNICTFC